MGCGGKLYHTVFKDGTVEVGKNYVVICPFVPSACPQVRSSRVWAVLLLLL